MLSDPICALATAPGRAALAVVRLSGTGAGEIARRILGWPPDRLTTDRVAYLSAFRDSAGRQFDRGLATFFTAPASYTGEDAVEFSCHGGLLAPAQLVSALVAAGARQAAPGEFTRRAVLNGKLDLLGAEAVADLIDAQTAAQGRAALHQLEGGLSRRLSALRTRLLDLISLLSYEIDFPEEDDGPIDSRQIREVLSQVRASLRQLIDTAPLGARLREGALVVFAGRPNVGKSSLFNALLGRMRALVAEAPGTTRDTIEADGDLDGWPVRLADTAGLRVSDDPIEQMGIEVSRRYLKVADLVLLCVEAGQTLDPDEESIARWSKTLVVRTKVDFRSAPGTLAVSATTGWGLDRLRQAMIDRLFSDLARYGEDEPMLTRERHRIALVEAAAALDEGDQFFADGGDSVLAAHHVRRSISAVDELIGAIDVEEVLGRVFSQFCVGK